MVKADKDKVFRGLRTFNIAMGVFHLLQGLLMLAISSDFSLPVTRGFLDFDVTTRTLVPTSVEIFRVQLGPAIASFLFMSATAHFLLGTVLFDKYVKDLKMGVNRYRWYEYSVSASVMIVCIAMLTGVYDVGSLLMMFSLNAFMIIFGLQMELHNQGRKELDWNPFIYGCIAGAIPWVIIAIYLFGSGGGDGGPPDFVYWIFLSIGVFFNCFAINMVLQYKKVGKWKDYLYGERAYIILSLVGKSLLAWQVFAGTLRPA